MKRAVFALVLVCLFLTVCDIVAVELHYRPLGAWKRIWVWHCIFLWSAFLIPLVISYFLKSVVPLGTWLFFGFGLEDTVFYGLQGYLPDRFIGVSVLGVFEPSLLQVLVFNLIGILSIVSYVSFFGHVSVLDIGRKVYSSAKC